MHKQRIKYLIQREPLSPMLKIQLKLHKPNFPICPLVNGWWAPTYKVVTFPATVLHEYLILNIVFLTVKFGQWSNKIYN
jgi:hypothetical protein